NACHGIPGVADVPGRAPEISADIRTPLPDIKSAVLAKAVDNWPLCAEQCLAHDLINSRHFFVRIERARAAPVVLQIIDSPGSVSARVLLFVSVTTFITRAGVWSRRRINSQLQAFAVDVISERLHVGKFLVRLDVALAVPTGLPGIVDV